MFLLFNQIELLYWKIKLTIVPILYKVLKFEQVKKGALFIGYKTKKITFL